MRVLMVSSLWPPEVIGGAERYAHELARSLEAASHEVGVITLGVPGPDVVAIVPPRAYPLQAWAGQPSWRRLAFHAADVHRPATSAAIARAVAEWRPDVVHTHALQGLSGSALTTPRRRGVAHVHTLHDYWLLCQRTSLVRSSGEPCAGRCVPCSWFAAARSLAVRRGEPDVVLAPSAALARRHQEAGLFAGRTRTALHPVPPSRPRRPRPERPVTFGFLGQLTQVKGISTLLAAFGRLERDARLVIAGDGPLRGDVERATGPACSYLGWIDGDAKDAFFDAIDCLVVPSTWQEPAGLVVGEALAAGVPVIGADAGGLPEYVAPACRPLLFPPGDANALADRLLRFIGEPDAFPATVAHLPTRDQHRAVIEDAYAAARAARGSPP